MPGSSAPLHLAPSKNELERQERLAKKSADIWARREARRKHERYVQARRYHDPSCSCNDCNGVPPDLIGNAAAPPPPRVTTETKNKYEPLVESPAEAWGDGSRNEVDQQLLDDYYQLGHDLAVLQARHADDMQDLQDESDDKNSISDSSGSGSGFWRHSVGR